MVKQLIKLSFGSDLYGTRTPTSDTDYKGVHVPSGRELVMHQMQKVISHSTGSDKVKNTLDDIDDESFSLLKYFDMLKKGDMVACELLFVSEEQAKFMSPEWKDIILPNKMKFMSREIRGFVSYVRKQSSKYGIRGSRISAARNAMELFYGWMAMHGPNTKIRDVPYFQDFLKAFCGINEHAEIIQLPIAKGSTETAPYFECINRKVGYNIALKDAHDIYKRAFDEFGARALAAERNEGVDWKALYHAIRVSEQAMELLTTNSITFPRHNVEDLLSIKRGEHPYRKIADRLENNLDKLEQLMLISDLPEKIDEDFMDEVVHELHLRQIKKDYSL